jgi:cysteine-rich repeat protein
MSMRTCSSLVMVSLALGCPSSDDGATGESTGSGETSNGPSSSVSVTLGEGSGSTSTAETSTGVADSSESSTGIPTTCGNGEMDDGEECDDGNNDEGDACHADCTNAFEITWTNLHDGTQSSFDSVNDVWIDDAGNIYALGFETTTGQGANVWLQQYMPDGTEGWTFTYDGMDSNDDYGISLTVAADGGLLIAGNTQSDMTDVDILILRVDPDTQMVDWETIVDGPGMGAGANDDFDSGRALATTSDGGVVVVGSVAVDMQAWDMWIGKYDDAGAEVWTATRDDAAHDDNIARAVLVGASDEAIVFGDDYMGETGTGIALVYDADGALQDAQTQTFDMFVDDAVYDADGNIVLTGNADLGNTAIDAVTRKYDPGFTQIWQAVFDGSMQDDFGQGVFVDGAGNVVVAGMTQRTGEQGNGFVAVFDADGVALWSDEYNTMDIDLEESWSAAAVDAMGDVVVVGYAPVLGHQNDGFTRKYHPL